MLDINVPKSKISLKHGEKVVLLGSCFSDNLLPYFENAGFEVKSNPLGIIFHPLALATIVKDAIEENYATKPLNQDDLWFDWRASGTVYAKSEVALSELIASRMRQLKVDLSSAKLLIVTFGTAWEYRLPSGEIVGNCHKHPAGIFEKSLSEAHVLVEVWTEIIAQLKALNPQMNIVFTVSPVRHVRDGLVENNRSKARLIELVHSLNDCEYFPSYEIVTDVLRDYRFYKEDLIHPNNQAVAVVWSHLSTFLFDQDTLGLNQQIEKVNAMEGHLPIYPESNAHRKFKAHLEQTMADLMTLHPEIYWNIPQKKPE